MSYGGENVLQDVNLEIEQFEHCAILGANGSGKSTLIKLFSNDVYSRFSANSTKKLFGKEQWSIFELKKQLGIITNDLHYYMQKETPDITGFEAVISSYHSSIGVFDNQEYSEAQAHTTIEVMKRLGIESLLEKPLCEMSTGELRKCIIARALVHNPKALLLDEPTVGLDIKAQIDFIDTLRSLSTEVTIILITHHIEEIFPEVKKVILLKDRTIFQQGDKDSLMNSQNLSHIFGVDLELGFDGGRYFMKSAIMAN